jgi:hypothetical protein
MVRRPYEAFPIGCQKEEVSFRRREDLEEAAGKSYFELMLRCSAVSMDGDVEQW